MSAKFKMLNATTITNQVTIHIKHVYINIHKQYISDCILSLLLDWNENYCMSYNNTASSLGTINHLSLCIKIVTSNNLCTETM